MKRRQFLQVTGLGLATTAVAMPAIAQASPAIRWRLTSSFPKSLDIVYGTSETISRFVAEATDNQFLIQPFAAGEIVPGLSAMDSSAMGSKREELRVSIMSPLLPNSGARAGITEGSPTGVGQQTASISPATSTGR